MADIATLQIRVDTNQVKTANKDLDNLSNRSQKAERSSQGLASSFMALKSAIPIAGVGLFATAMVKASDSLTQFTAQLRNATKSQNEFNDAFENVRNIASRAQSPIEAVGATYARLTNALRELNVNQNQVAQVTETVALGLKVNGASAEETASAMLQLSQSFGSGRMQGDEFRSAMETMPSLMREVAKTMGVGVGELKNLASEGKITSEVLLATFTNSQLTTKLREQAQSMRTVGGSVTEAKNEMLLFLGEMAKRTGVVDAFTFAIDAGKNTLRGFNDQLLTGKIRIEGFLPAYNEYRKKIDGELKKNSTFEFAPTITSEGGKFNLGEYAAKPEVKKATEEELKAQEDKNKKLKELRDKAIAEANAAEVRRLNVAIWVNEQIYADAKQKADDAAVIEKKKNEEITESNNKRMDIEQRRADENFANAQRIAKETTSEWDDAFRELKQSVDGYSRDMSRSLAQFALGGKMSFADMIDNMLLKLLEFANQKFIFDPLFKAITGQIESAGGGGNLLGSLASSIGNFFTGGVGMNAGAYSIDQNPYLNFAGARASGGNVSAGSSYLVGERGAELFVPNQNGAIVPNGGQSKTNVTVNVIEAQGTKANVQQQQNPDGTMSINVIVEQLYGVMNRDLQRGTGIAPTIERRYGLNRVAGAY